MLPFTTEQFLGVFESYNRSVWPAQFVLFATALVLIVLAIWKRRFSDKVIGVGLANVFGIIHGDLIQANYLLHGGEVRVIDFADFGYGHFLYDMGITLFGLWGLDENQTQREAFLSGYREVRPLSPGHEDWLDLFIAARAVVQAHFVMGSQHPDDQKIASKYIRKGIDGLKLWLR